ncbi:MAG: ISAs1 family transposase, partial [Ruminococcus flavefaciens]|nr:ISAs1 family transposase [Ruminococcus flavefaciens]
KPEQLEKCFVNWVKSVCEIQEDEIVSVDGKTLMESRYDDYSVRIETRQYFLSSEIHDFVNTDEWKGLASIGMVKSKRIIDCTESVERRYFINSLTDLDKFSQSGRMHWGIENNLHWCLDMNFNEDRCCIRMDNSGENLVVIRHISLNLYKSFSSVILNKFH